MKATLWICDLFKLTDLGQLGRFKVAPEFVERMAADIEAKELFFKHEHLVHGPWRDGWQIAICLWLGSEIKVIEQTALPRTPISLPFGAAIRPARELIDYLLYGRMPADLQPVAG